MKRIRIRKGKVILKMGIAVCALCIVATFNYSYIPSLETPLRRVKTFSRITFNLPEVIPARRSEGFQSLYEWIESFESLPEDKSRPLTIAFMLGDRVVHEVSFKIAKEEFLDDKGLDLLADYVSLLVLWGQAFIGGDSVIGDWSPRLFEDVKERFETGKKAVDFDADGNRIDVYYGLRGMLEYLKGVYGGYSFRRMSTEEINTLPQVKNPSFLMEVDKAIVDLNPTARGFWVPNAGPYGLAGVIEQYLNQNGVYNYFCELVNNDPEFKEELASKGLLPVLEPGEKSQRRNILKHVLTLLESEELSSESRGKIEGIFREIGRVLGYTIKITQKFMPVRNIVITGKVTQGRAGEIIKEEALKVEDSAVIWLPDDINRIDVGDTELGRFEVEPEKLREYGQALAMAAQISKKLHGSPVEGEVIGIDCGSSDVKIVYAENGKVLFTKVFEWRSSNITAETHPSHQEIIEALINLARLKVALDKKETLTEEEKSLKQEVEELEKDKSGSVETYEKIMMVVNEAKRLGIEFANFEGFSLSWAGAVLNNKIVGRASIVKGITSDEDFRRLITPLGENIARDFFGDDYEGRYLVINDGEAAAILATMMGLHKVLALAFGTSTGGGYVGTEDVGCEKVIDYIKKNSDTILGNNGIIDLKELADSLGMDVEEVAKYLRDPHVSGDIRLKATGEIKRTLAKRIEENNVYQEDLRRLIINALMEQGMPGEEAERIASEYLSEKKYKKKGYEFISIIETDKNGEPIIKDGLPVLSYKAQYDPYVHITGNWHPTVHVLVVDRNGNVLLRRKGGKVDISASGHLEVLEDFKEGALRELREEVPGIQVSTDDLELVGSFKKTGGKGLSDKGYNSATGAYVGKSGEIYNREVCVLYIYKVDEMEMVNGDIIKIRVGGKEYEVGVKTDEGDLFIDSVEYLHTDIAENPDDYKSTPKQYFEDEELLNQILLTIYHR